MRNRVFLGLASILVLAAGVIGLVACTGPSAEPVPGTPAKPTKVEFVSKTGEACASCHGTAGAAHQAKYEELYQDGVIKVTDLSYSFSSSPDTTKITFKIAKNSKPFSGLDADSLNIYFVPYTASKTFEANARLSLKGKLTYDSASGVTTSTLIELKPEEKGYVNYDDVGKTNGLVVVYGLDESTGTIPDTRVNQAKYPFAALYKTGGGVDYVSAANNAGCEKCHSVPFLKHGYIYGQVGNDVKTDFYTCKACHLDNGAGGHFEWKLLVEDPALAQKYIAGSVNLTASQKATYAYKTSLMNDVHLSHAMEFPYPQSMSNCVTCHEGKIDMILADANFTVDTCKSCHPVNGPKEGTDPKRAPALKNIMPASIHEKMDLEKVDCASCHKGAFKKIHTGYEKTVYTDSGQKYSDAIKVKIDSASVASNKLTIKFSAAESPDIAGFDVSKITPTVLVGLYGYDTHDYIVGPHERLVDDNSDGKLDSNDKRNLEYVAGEKHPRFNMVSATGGKWEVTADLSKWADLISNKTVKRAEIGIIPTLKNADNVTLALNAPTRTFDLGKNAFDDKFYNPIVKVADGCNKCHDALATTFHSPDRGGSIIICGLCHTTKSGGSHLELQSRSIDSYIHAIHSFQAFDIGSVNFADPVAKLHYEEHIAMPYPKHGTDCESCHNAGTYNVPDQSKALPGLLSASSTIKGTTRNIGKVPSYVTGPSGISCGGCHKAQLINEDDAKGLAEFFQHLKFGGYLIENGPGVLDSSINSTMQSFKK